MMKIILLHVVENHVNNCGMKLVTVSLLRVASNKRACKKIAASSRTEFFVFRMKCVCDVGETLNRQIMLTIDETFSLIIVYLYALIDACPMSP